VNDELFPDAQHAEIERLTAICRRDIAPHALELDGARRFPTESIDALRREGFLALAVEKKYGGMGGGFGGDYLLNYRAVEEIAKYCTSTSQIFAVQTATCSQIAAMGNEEQKQRLLGDVASNGDLWGSWASELGPFALGAGTTARKVDHGYLVNGDKFFSTNSVGASRFLLWAAEEGGDLIHNMLIMAVDAKAPGVEIIDDWDGMGQRATASGTTKFRDVFVPMSDVLGGEANAFYRAPAALGPIFQLGFAAIYLGTAEGAFTEACQYLTSHRSLVRTVSRIAEDPVVQLHVGDMESRLAAGRLLVYDAACRLKAVELDPARRAAAALAVYKAKVFATEVAISVTHDVFSLCGTSATLAGNKFEMFWRNVRTLTLHDPVDRRREVIGKAVLGIAEPPIAAV
jgi:alkylation response protein AidB-like acyl-CoA dehydrogenase